MFRKFEEMIDSITLSDRSLHAEQKRYDIVYPEDVSPPNVFPDEIIPVPMYYEGILEIPPAEIHLKTIKEIELLKSSCFLAKKILNAAKNFIREGLTTDELDKYIHNLVIQNKAYPSPFRFNGFPKSICTSVNNVVCHGIPDKRILKNGDIITVDITVFYNGFHGDCAATFLIGDVDEQGKQLVSAAENILYKAISVCKPGEHILEIANCIEKETSKYNFCIIPSVFGHGIGRYFHEEPLIPHTTLGIEVGEDCIMKPGMAFTIEPAIGESSQHTFILDDQWTLITEDDSRTAQFEHTILITDTGVEILTK
ncbi:hypothetical protein PGB90_008836 [Kerria lacca]